MQEGLQEGTHSLPHCSSTHPATSLTQSAHQSAACTRPRPEAGGIKQVQDGIRAVARATCAPEQSAPGGYRPAALAVPQGPARLRPAGRTKEVSSCQQQQQQPSPIHSCISSPINSCIRSPMHSSDPLIAPIHSRHSSTHCACCSELAPLWRQPRRGARVTSIHSSIRPSIYSLTRIRSFIRSFLSLYEISPAQLLSSEKLVGDGLGGASALQIVLRIDKGSTRERLEEGRSCKKSYIHTD